MVKTFNCPQFWIIHFYRTFPEFVLSMHFRHRKPHIVQSLEWLRLLSDSDHESPTSRVACFGGRLDRMDIWFVQSRFLHSIFPDLSRCPRQFCIASSRLTQWNVCAYRLFSDKLSRCCSAFAARSLLVLLSSLLVTQQFFLLLLFFL